MLVPVYVFVFCFGVVSFDLLIRQQGFLCLTVLLFCYAVILLYCSPVLLFYCSAVMLFYCFTALLLYY